MINKKAANQLINILLWPRRQSVLKDISLSYARKFHTPVFICPKGKFRVVNQLINFQMRNLRSSFIEIHLKRKSEIVSGFNSVVFCSEFKVAYAHKNQPES